jgi:hypothetical protein
LEGWQKQEGGCRVIGRYVRRMGQGQTMSSKGNGRRQRAGKEEKEQQEQSLMGVRILSLYVAARTQTQAQARMKKWVMQSRELLVLLLVLMKLLLPQVRPFPPVLQVEQHPVSASFRNTPLHRLQSLC